MGLMPTGVAASEMAAKLMSQRLHTSASSRAPHASPQAALAAPAESTTPASNVQHGGLILTGNPLDLAIGGAGFFILDGDEGPVLTRLGRFRLDAQGFLVDEQGRHLRPRIAVPEGAVAVQVNALGDVVAVLDNGQRRYLSSLELGTVPNPAGLRPLGNHAFGLSSATGPIVRSAPGMRGFGRIVQGGLEASTIDLLSEALDSVVSSRAFSANAAVFRIASAMVSKTIPHDRSEQDKPDASVDLSRTQAAHLLSVFGSTPEPLRAEPLSPAVQDRLSARRMSAGEIAETWRVVRKHDALRFSELADGNAAGSRRRRFTDQSVLVQELLLAQRRASELRRAS